MTLLSGAIIEGKDLWQTVVWAVGTGVGITLVFSVAVYGATRFADLNRDERHGAAAASAALGLLAFAVCIAAVVIGIIVMTHKS